MVECRIPKGECSGYCEDCPNREHLIYHPVLKPQGEGVAYAISFSLDELDETINHQQEER